MSDDLAIGAASRSRNDRRAHERAGWIVLEDWAKFLLVPGSRVVECKPSLDGQAIFYKVER